MKPSMQCLICRRPGAVPVVVRMEFSKTPPVQTTAALCSECAEDRFRTAEAVKRVRGEAP